MDRALGDGGVFASQVEAARGVVPEGVSPLMSEGSGGTYFLIDQRDETWKWYYHIYSMRKSLYTEFPSGIPETENQLPVVMNSRVKRFIRYFQGPGRKPFERWLARSGRYIPMMRKVLEEEGLPTDLVFLAMIESGFNVRARSHRGATGPWQFMRYTAKKYGLRVDYWVDERMDPVKSTEAAARYLRDLYAMFNSWELAAAGYNAGEGRVQAAIRRVNDTDFWEISKRSLPRETKDYVPKLIAALLIAKNPEKYGFTGINYHEPVSWETVNVPPRKSLKDIARIISVRYRLLKELNPSLIRGATPPGDDYPLKVPVGYRRVVELKYARIAALSDVRRPRYARHRVRRGDTLSVLAKTYHTTVAAIRRANGIRGSLIREGQVLKIPLKSTPVHKRRPRRGGTYYTVKPGETPSHIARRFDVSVRRLLAANGIRDPRRLRAGSRILIPRSDARPSRAAIKYIVRKGDTPYDIALSHGVSVEALLSYNGSLDPKRLKVGQVLFIPAQTAARDGKVVWYKVRRGDTLWGIARRWGVSVDDLKRWNGISSTKLVAGDSLKIYAR